MNLLPTAAMAVALVAAFLLAQYAIEALARRAVAAVGVWL